MTSAVQRLLDEARKLPSHEQADLLDALICDRPQDAAWEQAWAAECVRREEAVARGEARLVPLDELKARLGR